MDFVRTALAFTSLASMAGFLVCWCAAFVVERENNPSRKLPGSVSPWWFLSAKLLPKNQRYIQRTGVIFFIGFVASIALGQYLQRGGAI